MWQRRDLENEHIKYQNKNSARHSQSQPATVKLYEESTSQTNATTAARDRYREMCINPNDEKAFYDDEKADMTFGKEFSFV